MGLGKGIEIRTGYCDLFALLDRPRDVYGMRQFVGIDDILRATRISSALSISLFHRKFTKNTYFGEQS